MCQKDRGDDIFQCDELNKQLPARQLPGAFVGVNHFDRIWWQLQIVVPIRSGSEVAQKFHLLSGGRFRNAHSGVSRPIEGQQENLEVDFSWATRKSYSSGITMVGVGIEIRPSMICFLLLKVTLM